MIVATLFQSNMSGGYPRQKPQRAAAPSMSSALRTCPLASLSAFAHEGAIAVENAQLYEATRHGYEAALHGIEVKTWLMREMNHRVRNNLARAISRQRRPPHGRRRRLDAVAGVQRHWRRSAGEADFSGPGPLSGGLMRAPRLAIASLIIVMVAAVPSQTAQRADGGAIQQIRDEASQRSQLAATAGTLTDVYGPRLTGSPNLKAAADFVIENIRFVHDPLWNKRFFSLQAAHDGEGWFWQISHAVVTFGGLSI